MHGLYIIVNRLASISNQKLQKCAKARPLIKAWTVFVKACEPCINEMYSLCSSSTLFEHSMILSRAINFAHLWSRWAMDEFYIREVPVPSFGECACVFL